MPTTDDIIRDIDRLFGDTRVPASTTRSNLRALRDHIEMLLETLAEDEEG